MPPALVLLNDTEPVACDHPLCPTVIQVGEMVYPARTRDNEYCSVLCRNRHSKILAAKRFITKNPDYERWGKIQRKYGLTREQFEMLWEKQGGSCAICRTPLFDARPCVDHQHETGAVRGLLCTPCNTGIGMLQDDPDVMLRAAAYVRNPIAQDATSVHSEKEVS